MQVADYAGATARLDIEQALKMVRADKRRWRAQPKVDGCYARCRTGRDGELVSVLSRTGTPLPQAAGLLGQVVGPANAVLIGELEAHTEAGDRAHREQGYRRVHLFDMVESGHRSLRSAPYSERYALLMQSRAELEMQYEGWQHLPDRSGAARDDSGRYAPRVPIGWRLAPVVPQYAGDMVESAWRDLVERDGGEGLVLVDQTAKVGQRSSKRKVKMVETHDLLVTSISPRAASLSWRGGSIVAYRPRWAMAGMLVEVACDGYYASGEPRFARIVRPRSDLN